MAGHSKWSNIKRRKEAEDSKRGKLFTKLARDITVAAKSGGKDTDTNPALRAAIDKAKANNMPKNNIERAIAKGAGRLGEADFEEVFYEGYGPSGVAIYIRCLTGNKNRTVSEIRNVFSRNDGSLGEVGSVSYIFKKSLDEPSYKVPISGDLQSKVRGLITKLESLDDVENVYHNAEFS